MSEEISKLSQIEAKMVRYGQIQDTIRRLEEEKELLKLSLSRLMKEEHMGTHRVAYNDSMDIKATVGETEKKKFDYEQMAEDLEISVGSAKDKVSLVELTENGQLTSNRFKQYFYKEVEDSVSLRKVQAL